MNITEFEYTQQQSRQILDDWLNSCRRHGKYSRNTIAMGIVVFDHLRHDCPVSREKVVSQGGEITGARARLGNLLESYRIPRSYLKEITTRQAHQDGQKLFERFEWGDILMQLPQNKRDALLVELIDHLIDLASAWLKRQNLKFDIDRRQAPATWINIIVENAKGHSGGIVEQQLVGAKLARRFKDASIANQPSHAGDVQTDRSGDFQVSSLVYHVTSAPSRDVVQKCARNIMMGQHPILLIPRDQENRARILAQDEGVEREMTILSIEDFVAMNIIELATDENKDFFTILKEIIEIYNQRLAEVETDLSLQIEVH